MLNFNLLNFDTEQEYDNSEVLDGLQNSNQKVINPKFFYDKKGSELFDKITTLNEYYPTKTELEILEKEKKTLKKSLPESSVVVEFGSGSNVKIKKFLDALNNPTEYIPIDISKKHLEKNAFDFAKKNPHMKVTAICADFNSFKSLDYILKHNKNKIGFFPGSTIGNFLPIQAKMLLKNIAKILGPKNYLVVGVDLKKKISVIEKAYNDSSGITAKFNKNVLNNINKICGASFNVENFEHNAFYNKKKNRVEMHLKSKKFHTVKLMGQKIVFNKGETIHTESSYKYSINDFVDIAISSGYELVETLTDEKEFFCVFCLKIKKN